MRFPSLFFSCIVSRSRLCPSQRPVDSAAVDREADEVVRLHFFHSANLRH